MVGGVLDLNLVLTKIKIKIKIEIKIFGHGQVYCLGEMA
jgi:hypothetical protein